MARPHRPLAVLLALAALAVAAPAPVALAHATGRGCGASRGCTSTCEPVRPKPPPCGPRLPAGRNASRFGTDVPRAWGNLLYGVVRDENLTPPQASRLIGYFGVALYESVVPGMPRYRSLGGQLNGLGTLPRAGAHKRHHWPVCANAAAAAVLRGLLPGASAATLDAIADLEASLQGAAGTSDRTHERSVAFGRRIAAAVLDWSATDGYDLFHDCPFTVPVGEGLWVPTPPAFRPNPLEPCWGSLRTFALASGESCAPPPHPEYSTDPGSDFFQEAQEVYDTTTSLTADQEAIAYFWSDDPGATGTPPGHWVAILTQVLAADDGYRLDDAVEAFAAVGIAVADAFISCWNAKYDWNLLRPVTYLQAEIDGSWTPLLPTPPFPEYTSGHSVQSGAASTVLTALLGIVAFDDHTHDARGLPSRSFSSFAEAADEAAISRLYGGIHFRAGIDDGVAQGRCIGNSILDRVRFRR